MKIDYVSACFDLSGYAEAARHNIGAMTSVGLNVNVVSVSFESFKSDLGKLGELVKNLSSSKRESKIQIIHTTPNIYPKFVDKNKYNIGYTVWETDRLPDEWVPLINSLNEVWVPCEHNIECFKNSGVTIPIFKIPHCFNEAYLEDGLDNQIQSLAPNDFAFYSVFQWTERKNPSGLLRAYLTEFKKEENVALILKTYLVNPTDSSEIDKIKKEIADIKSTLYLKDYPKILLVCSLLSRSQVQSLHNRGDCYVSLHRCEGFGVPIAEAMLAGKPIIVTGYGGPNDFVYSSNGYKVDYFITPCHKMPWATYHGLQNWAEPNIDQAKKYMRESFSNREHGKQLGLDGQKFIKSSLSWETVGNLIKSRIEEIERTKL